MPGTVPKLTDPSLVTSSSGPSPSPSKAAVTSDPSIGGLLDAPAGHPTAGIASTGAAQLTATNALTSALAPTNEAAQMTARPNAKGKAKAKAPAPVTNDANQDDADLKKFIETGGHFSLVR